jgi:hypothetical protein
MDELTQALKLTLHQLVKQMSEQAKNQAINDGWELDIASSIDVRHEGNSLAFSVSDEYAEKAFIHEFGDQNNSPKATLRKFGNQNKSAEATALAIFDQIVDKVL